MDTIAGYLADYANSISYEDLPPEVVHKAKGLLIDAIGCAMGAYTSEPVKIARRMAERVFQCDMPATIFGSGWKSTPELATFANGVMIRYLDLNDGFSSVGGGHPSENFAPVLACADAVHASGKQVIVSAVLAYEVFCRLQDHINPRSRGFDQAVSGVISSAIGASKILGLSREQMVQSINLAVNPNISLNQARRAQISMWKGCSVANAARNAVFATLLAGEGMTGPSPIFEGSAGLMKIVTGPFHLEEFGGNGRPYRIMAVSIKRYPCGKHGQTGIDAALKLRSKISDVDDIERVNIGTCEYGKAIMATEVEKWHPATRETADHSIPYVVGVALMFGPLQVRHFSDEYLNNPDLLKLLQKIRVEVTEECNRLYPNASASRVEIITKSGTNLSEFVQHHHGHYKNPLTDEEIEQKFCSLSRDLLSKKQIKKIISQIWRLEKVDDIRKVIELIRV